MTFVTEVGTTQKGKHLIGDDTYLISAGESQVGLTLGSSEEDEVEVEEDKKIPEARPIWRERRGQW